MSWSYSLIFTGTATGKRNQVRLLAQENVSTRQKVADEEIDHILSEEANVYMAAARVAELVAARVGPISSKRVGSLSVTYGYGGTQDSSYYTQLARRLRSRGSGNQVPSAGGLSRSEKLAAEQNVDRVAPQFTLKMHDHPDTTDTPTTTALGVLP